VKIEDLCAGCAATEPSGEHQKALKPYGLPVTTVGGAGKWQEDTYSYKCSKCGAIWEEFVESGATGHYKSWNRVDPPQPN
jgi:hypothetical protein